MLKHLQSFFLILICFLSFTSLPAQDKPVEFSASFTEDGGRPKGWVFDTTDTAFWRLEDGWITTGSGSDIATPDSYSFGTIETVNSAAWRDYTVSAQFWMKAANGRVVMVGRWKDRDNHYRAVIDVGMGKRVLRLEKVEAGKVTQLASQDLDISALGITNLESATAKDVVLLQMRLAGPDIAVAINSKPILTATDATFKNGTAGIGEYRNEVFFDNVQVALLPLAESSITAPSAGRGKIFSVQVYSAADLNIARTIVRQLSMKGYPVFLDQADGGYQVFVGEFANAQEARKFQQLMIVNEGFSFARVVDVSANRTVAQAATPTAAQKETVQQSMERVFADLDWDKMTPDQQQKILDMVVRRSAFRGSLQSVDGIMSMKDEVSRMTSEQKETLVKLEERLAKESSKFGTTTSDLARQIIEVTSKVPGEIKAVINEQMNTELDQLRVRAQTLENERDFRGARLLWGEILVKAQAKPDIASEANSKIKSLQELIDGLSDSALIQTSTAADKKVQNIIYAALAILFVLIVVVFLMLRHYKKVVEDIQEGGMGSLSARSSQTAGLLGQPDQDNSFPGDQLGLLDQPADSTSADFMIPERKQSSGSNLPQEPDDFNSAFGSDDNEPLNFGTSSGKSSMFDKTEESDVEDNNFSFGFSGDQSEPSGEPTTEDATPEADNGFSMNFNIDGSEDEPPSDDTSDSSDDLNFGMNFNMPSEETTPEPEATPSQNEDNGFSMNFDFNSEDDNIDEVAPATTEADNASPGFDNFSMNFNKPMDEDTSGNEEPIPTNTDDSDDIMLSFDESTIGIADEPTGAAITAAEIPESADIDDDIVFNFEDPVAESTNGEKSRADDPLYESIELDAMPQSPLDISIGSVVDDQMATVEMPFNPLMDGLDLPVTPGAGDDTPPPPMDTEIVTEESELTLGEILLSQNFGSDKIGALPTGWTGDECKFATLAVVEDPDGSGDKCLKFEKSEGLGTTAFVCKFPDVSGRICIEFDLRCDEKNKHLLGFYIEADNDFRRSVHTVVQCTHPDRPAHLRVFTRPTSYEMGHWARVRYVIDLNEGFVDGYVDGELVAEGVRMGTKTLVLNTLAIRDSAETVGSLLVRNLMIAQVEA